MDRKELLKKILDHLGEALYLMETTEAKPDDDDDVWSAVNDANELVETKLNAMLMAEIKEKA